MNDLEYYLGLKYPFYIETLKEEDGGGYFITYPDLEGCMSDGDTVEEAIAMGEDAKLAWIKAKIEMNLSVPEPYSDENKYNGRITLRTPKSLHKLLVQNAEVESISLNQYLIFLLSHALGTTERKIKKAKEQSR